MKRLGKRRIISLIMALSMAVTTVFSANISNVRALTNAEKARELVSKMTLEEKIGQKLMLSFRSGWTMRDGTKISSVQTINDEIHEIIGEYDIGSVILFAANFNSDAKVNVELTDGLQKAAMDKDLGKNSIPLLIATDQEGGIVYRLTGGTALPGNMALGASGNTENAVKAGNIIGSELNAVGVNVNFAPDADVNNNPNNPVIGLRSFSSNPQLAAKFVSAYIEGVQSNNVATAAKHFPGHGNVATDSHTGLPSVPATKEELYKTELVPFQAAIDAGTDMVMTAHIQFPNIVTEEIYSDKKGLADAIAQAKAIDKSVYTTESWEAAAEALNTLKVVLQTAENVNLTHKLAQSVVDENETDLRDKYNTVLSLLVYKSDKKALSDLIAEAKKLDKDHYTIETWQNFEKALENAESIYDGNVPQDEVDLAKEALEKAKNELLEKNKKELSAALEMAKQVTPEQLDKVVPAVVTEFKAALENAQIIFDKKDANELEINKAFERLSNVMQMLEFYKGDKTQLSALVEKIEKLNKNDYLSATWKNLESVLTTAKDVLNNPDALEIEVSETHDQLVRTFLQLRLKPNKDLLSELINKAENTDQTKYTAVSLLSLKSALVEAKAVLDNNEATQDEVTAVEILLKTALNNLVVKEITLDDPNAQTPPDAKPGNGAITATKTGDDSMMLTFALAGLLAFAGSVIVLKKKEE